MPLLSPSYKIEKKLFPSETVGKVDFLVKKLTSEKQKIDKRELEGNKYMKDNYYNLG